MEIGRAHLKLFFVFCLVNIRVRSYYIDLYIDGSLRGHKGVQRLEAGANVTKTFTWTKPPK